MAPWAPERYWSAIREERARFAAELAALPLEAWSAPTLCGAWSVEDVVAHLTAGARTGRWAWLGEVVVHGTDVREPLGLPGVPDPETVEAVAVGYARRDFAVASRTVAKGVRLVADDSGFCAGDGPEVTGTTLDLVMAMAGRPSAVGRLAGEGAPVLAAAVARRQRR